MNFGPEVHLPRGKDTYLIPGPFLGNRICRIVYRSLGIGESVFVKFDMLLNIESFYSL